MEVDVLVVGGRHRRPSMCTRPWGPRVPRFQTARAMGINFVKGKVAKIEEQPDGNLKVRVELMESTGSVSEQIHDLVVPAPGMLPGCNPSAIVPLELDSFGFVRSAEPKTDPTLTSMPGVFVAGTAAGPKDIVDSIVEASAAAVKAAIHLAEPVT